MTVLILALTLAMQTGASPVQTIAKEMMSQIDEPRQAVARDAAELSALWRQHAPAKPAPTVDFKTRTVVAVFLGSRMSAGYAVEITGTREDKGMLVVQWQERKPNRDEVTAQIITSPAVIASIPKFSGEIKFEKVDP